MIPPGNMFLSGTYTLTFTHRRQSILSITLFILKINSIISCLLLDIKCYLYVDDLAIYYSSSHMSDIERKLQQFLNILGRWCNENGFKFSPTVCPFLSTTETTFRS